MIDQATALRTSISHMKFAICNETFLDWPLAKAFGFAADCGYTGIEIAPFTLATNARDVSASARAEVCRQADAAGLEVVGLHWLLAKTEGYHLTSPQDEVRQRTAEYVQDLARLCRDLGGSRMIFGSPLQRNILPGVTPQQAFDYAAGVVESCLGVLEETGVTLCMEPLAPSEGNFLNTAAEAVRLIERIGHPNCRLILDCKAMSSESVPIPELIRRHAATVAPLPRQRPQPPRPRHGRAGLRADLRSPGRDRLSQLGQSSKSSTTPPASNAWPARASTTCAAR